MTIADSPIKIATQTPRNRRRSIGELLAPLDKIAATSPNLVANYEAHFESNGDRYELPRYLFVGPKGGDTPIRIGIFAGIHGDEPEGVHAIVQFIKLLEAKPELAAGYYLSFYPVCNPTGFEDATRFSRGVAAGRARDRLLLRHRNSQRQAWPGCRLRFADARRRNSRRGADGLWFHGPARARRGTRYS